MECLKTRCKICLNLIILQVLFSTHWSRFRSITSPTFTRLCRQILSPHWRSRNTWKLVRNVWSDASRQWSLLYISIGITRRQNARPAMRIISRLGSSTERTSAKQIHSQVSAELLLCSVCWYHFWYNYYSISGKWKYLSKSSTCGLFSLTW